MLLRFSICLTAAMRVLIATSVSQNPLKKWAVIASRTYRYTSSNVTLLRRILPLIITYVLTRIRLKARAPFAGAGLVAEFSSRGFVHLFRNMDRELLIPAQ